MIPLVDDVKILGPVVQLVSIDVVNFLSRTKGAPQLALHYDSMLGPVLTRAANVAVFAVDNCASLVRWVSRPHVYLTPSDVVAGAAASFPGFGNRYVQEHDFAADAAEQLDDACSFSGFCSWRNQHTISINQRESCVK